VRPVVHSFDAVTERIEIVREKGTEFPVVVYDEETRMMNGV
jgi:hypothetical protein